MTPTYDPFVTVAEMSAELGISRQRAHQLIDEHKLTHIKKGAMLLVEKADYNLLCRWRRRRDLAAAAGRLSIKLIRASDIDTICGICGSYAVDWKGTIACEQGHVIPWGREE